MHNGNIKITCAILADDCANQQHVGLAFSSLNGYYLHDQHGRLKKNVPGYWCIEPRLQEGIHAISNRITLIATLRVTKKKGSLASACAI